MKKIGTKQLLKNEVVDDNVVVLEVWNLGPCSLSGTTVGLEFRNLLRPFSRGWDGIRISRTRQQIGWAGKDTNGKGVIGARHPSMQSIIPGIDTRYLHMIYTSH